MNQNDVYKLVYDFVRNTNDLSLVPGAIEFATFLLNKLECRINSPEYRRELNKEVDKILKPLRTQEERYNTTDVYRAPEYKDYMDTYLRG